MTRKEAKTIIDTLVKLRKEVDDKQASTAVCLYPSMKYNGDVITAGSRIRWGNVIKRATVDVLDDEENNPDNASHLWEDILYKDGIRVIHPNLIADMPFLNGELGWFGENIYESVVDNNMYDPNTKKDNWELYKNLEVDK